MNRENEKAQEKLQKHMWRLHRERVRKARCIVDHHPPPLNVGNFLRMTQLKMDCDGYINMMRANVGLMVNIGNIMQTTGVLKTFNSRYDMLPSSRRKVASDRLRAIEKANFSLGQRILNAKATFNTRPKMNKKSVRDWICANRRKEMEKFEVPVHILKKYTDKRNFKFNLPNDPEQLFNLFRPEIFLEIELVGFRSLGRLYFDLYTEAAPQIVYEFMRVCAENNVKQFAIKRLFPYLWMDGEITISEKVMLGPGPNNPIEYDKRALTHDTTSGVLSFRTMYLKDFKPGPMEFSISFKASPLFNKDRVCFGRLVGGWKVLDILRDYGMQSGRPKTPLRVRSCGSVML